MSSTSNRLVFLAFLLLSQLAGNAQAVPVRNDEAIPQTGLAAGAESNEALPSVDRLLPSPPASLLEGSIHAVTTPYPGVMAPPSFALESARQTGDTSLATERFLPHNGPTAAFGEPDPLARMLRSMVNVTRRQDTGSSPQRPAHDDPQIEIDLGEEGRAAVLEAKEAMAEAVRAALNPRAEEDGRITFSLVGVEGFHVASDGVSWALGFGDTVLGRFQSDTPEGNAGSDPRVHRADYVSNSGFNDKDGLRNPQSGMLPEEIMQAITFAREVIESPLTWFLLALFLVFRSAMAMVSAQVASRRQRRAGHKRRTHGIAGHRSTTARLDSDPARS